MNQTINIILSTSPQTQPTRNPRRLANLALRQRNQNLPGMGRVFNYVNLHVYHYAGNN